MKILRATFTAIMRRLLAPTEEQRLRGPEAEGLLRIGSGNLPKSFWDAPRPKDPAAAIRRGLIEERRER